jgi:hypothetical protein
MKMISDEGEMKANNSIFLIATTDKRVREKMKAAKV